MSPARPTAAPRQQVEVVLDADVLDAACRVGVLFHTAAHGREVFSFRYDPAWLRHPDAFAIDPDLSLHGGEAYPSSANGAFRIFLDSAPDRWGRVLLERREILRARDEARRPRTLNEWDYLLGVHDMCRLGALRFRLEENSAFLDDDARLSAPPLATLRELEAASLALEAPESEESPRFREWLNALLAPGSSLGGARPKANFTDTDQTLWIAKFPSRNDRRDIGAWEMVVHELAVRAGLHVPSARLLELGAAYRTFACQRFDRRGTRRRFFVSALTLLGRADGEGGSYLDLAEFLSTRGSVRHRDEDLRQLWTRVVFNILTSNTDDHLRNHGYILEGDGWRLAPAYDMNANPDGGSHALAINERDQTADIALALATAGYYGLKPSDAQSILSQVRSVVNQWSTVAASLNLPRSEIARMTSAFTAE